MGRGPDLAVEERALLHSKSRKRWGYARGRVNDGGVTKIQESRELCGLKASRRAISRVVTEVSRQERLSDERLKETSESTGVSCEANRVGAVGREAKLTPELTEAHREAVQRRAYSFTRLSVRQTKIELEKKGYVSSSSAARSRLRPLKRRRERTKTKPTLTLEGKKRRVRRRLDHVDKSGKRRQSHKLKSHYSLLTVGSISLKTG